MLKRAHWILRNQFHWFRQKLRPSITGPWWIARSAITQGSFVFNAREHRVSRDGIYARDERHAMILVSWIETFILNEANKIMLW